MKTLKTLLSALAIVAAFSVGAFAQQSDNANVNVTTEVVAGISVTNQADIDFGTITVGETKEAAVNTSNAGRVGVTSGASAAAFDITVAFPTQLTGGGGTIDLRAPVAGDVLAKDGSTNDSSDANGLTNSSASGTTVEGEFTASGTAFQIFVGAEIVDSGSAEVGTTHNGTITVTVSYQ